MSKIKTVTGPLSSIRRRINRDGDVWASAMVGDVEVLLFPEAYAEHADKIVDGATVSLRGQLRWGSVCCALIVDEVLW